MTTVTRVRTHRDFACDAPAGLDRTPRLEGAIATLPDDSVASLRLKVHSIELLEDVLDFMRDELRGAHGRPEMDQRGHQRAVLVPQDRAGVGGQRAIRQILGEQAHT